MTNQWYYQIMGEQRGPVDTDGLVALVRSNDIERDTFVRRDGDDWQSAERIEGLFAAYPGDRPQSPRRWYFRVMGEVRGPMPAATLRRLADTNDISRDTFVRMEEGEWVTADRVDGLFR